MEAGIRLVLQQVASGPAPDGLHAGGERGQGRGVVGGDAHQHVVRQYGGVEELEHPVLGRLMVAMQRGRPVKVERRSGRGLPNTQHWSA